MDHISRAGCAAAARRRLVPALAVGLVTFAALASGLEAARAEPAEDRAPYAREPLRVVIVPPAVAKARHTDRVVTMLERTLNGLERFGRSEPRVVRAKMW